MRRGEKGYRQLVVRGLPKDAPEWNCIACDTPLCWTDERGCPGRPVDATKPVDANYE